jgi:hypothetical protein
VKRNGDRTRKKKTKTEDFTSKNRQDFRVRVRAQGSTFEARDWIFFVDCEVGGVGQVKNGGRLNDFKFFLCLFSGGFI